MKKLIISLLIISILLPFMPYNAEAKSEYGFESSLSLYNINNTDKLNIIGVEVIDGEIYIDILIPYDGKAVSLSSIGKCPSSTKTSYTSATKSELISMKKKLDNQTMAVSSIIGFLLGLANPVVGGAGGYLLSQPSMMSSAIKDALYNRNKNKYTIRTKMDCEETNLGIRGIVHRYKITSIYIY